MDISPLLPSSDSEYEKVNHWKDEVVDESVFYLERLIGSGYKFTKNMWPGGVNEWPVIVAEYKPPKKESPSRKIQQAPKKVDNIQAPQSHQSHHLFKGRVKLVKLFVHQGPAKVDDTIILMWKS